MGDENKRKALINAHKKKVAQKQTAMLVIHDINNSIETMEYSQHHSNPLI